MQPTRSIRIVLYTRQPFLARGLGAVIRAQPGMKLAAWRESLAETRECLRAFRPDVLVVHLTGGISLAELAELRAADARCPIILWGEGMEGEFAFQAMQLGVRGGLPADTSIEDFLATLRNVHRGVACFESGMLENVLARKRVALTPRQGQIVSLVAQGLKNKEIAFSMGITEGTVKVYLYKLFRKLGLNDRLDMALYGRKNLFSGPPGMPRALGPPVPPMAPMPIHAGRTHRAGAGRTTEAGYENRYGQITILRCSPEVS